MAIGASIAVLAAACSSNGGNASGSGTSSSISPSGWLYVGSVSDADFNAANYQAQQAMAGEYHLKTEYQDNVSVADVESLATQDIASGAKTIVLTSSSWYTNLIDLAKKNPNVDFIGFIGSPQAPSGQPKNLWLMGLNFYDGEYVLGVLGGLQTKTNKIAYVAGLNIPGLIAGANAYAAGACSVNPHVRVTNLVVGSFDDATQAQNAAAALIRQGNDVLQVHLNGAIPGVVDAIKSSGRSVYWSGLNTDKHQLDASHYLGSVELNFTAGYRQVFKAIKQGTTTGFLDLAKNFTLSTLYNVDSATQAKVKTALQGVLSGSVNVPINTTKFQSPC